MSKNLKIGIVVADDDEYTELEEIVNKFHGKEISVLKHIGHRFTVDNGTEVVSALCGIGKVNAAATTMKLIDDGCNCILNYGLSGGISGVRRGDICLPESFLEHDFDLTMIGYKPCEKPSQDYIYYSDKRLYKIFSELLPFAVGGAAVTGDKFICSDEERVLLHNLFSATSCDMETAAIAYVCSVNDIPFISVRRISDDAGDDALTSYHNTISDSQISLSEIVLSGIKVIANSENLSN